MIGSKFEPNNAKGRSQSSFICNPLSEIGAHLDILSINSHRETLQLTLYGACDYILGTIEKRLRVRNGICYYYEDQSSVDTCRLDGKFDRC